jgi:hypothetical protein
MPVFISAVTAKKSCGEVSTDLSLRTAGSSKEADADALRTSKTSSLLASQGFSGHSARSAEVSKELLQSLLSQARNTKEMQVNPL